MARKPLFVSPLNPDKRALSGPVSHTAAYAGDEQKKRKKRRWYRNESTFPIPCVLWFSTQCCNAFVRRSYFWGNGLSWRAGGGAGGGKFMMKHRNPLLRDFHTVASLRVWSQPPTVALHVCVCHATAYTLVKTDARNEGHLKNTTNGGISAWSSTQGFWKSSCFPPAGAYSRQHSLLWATMPPGQKHKHEGMGMHINLYVLISPGGRKCNAGVHAWVVELKQQTAELPPSSRAQHSPLFPLFTEAPRKWLCSLACCTKAEDANLHLTPVSIYICTPIVLNYWARYAVISLKSEIQRRHRKFFKLAPRLTRGQPAPSRIKGMDACLLNWFIRGFHFFINILEVLW